MNYISLNFSLLKEQFVGDEEILVDMIKLLQEGSEDLLNSIREAVLGQNADQLKISAHTFKGIMSNFFSPIGVQSAYELELCGIEKKFDEAHLFLNRFENILMIFFHELRIIKSELDKIS